MRSLITIGLAFLLVTVSIGQERDREKEPPFFKGGFQLPTALANPSFKRFMSGVSDFAISFNLPVSKSIHLGLFAEHTYLSFNDLAIPELTNASMQITGGGLSFGYTVSRSEKTALEFALNGGYSYMLTSSQTCLNSTGNKQNVKGGVSIKPDVTFYIKSSEYLSFGIIGSYQLLLTEFAPSNLCLEEFEGSFPSDHIGPSHLFCIGFCFKANIPPRR